MSALSSATIASAPAIFAALRLQRLLQCVAEAGKGDGGDCAAAAVALG